MYSLAAALNTTVWSLYFSFTRLYIGVKLEGGIQAVLLITGLEWGFTLFAVMSGRLTSRVGGRGLVCLGATGFLPFLIAMGVKSPFTLAVILSLSSFTWAISWPSILSAVFSNVRVSPGRAYSYFTVGTGVGFSVGSAFMGPLYALTGPEGVFLVIAIMYLTTYLIFAAFFPRGSDVRVREGGELLSGSRSVLQRLILVLVALSLTILAREILYAVAPSKLSSELEKVITTSSELVKYTAFGVAYGGITAALSIPARILAGRLTDRYNPLKIFMFTTVAYMFLYWSFVKSEGWISIALWQVSLYPFLDTAVNTYIAKHVPGEIMTSGFGAAITFNAVGGLLILPLLANPNLDMDFLGYAVTAATVLSITLVLMKLGLDRPHDYLH